MTRDILNLQSFTLSLVYFCPQERFQIPSMEWKHPNQFGSCQVIQPHLSSLAILCPIALASRQSRLRRTQGTSSAPALCTCSSLHQLFFLLVLQLLTYILSPANSLQDWYETEIHVFSVCSSSAMFNTCHGVRDCLWKLPVCLFVFQIVVCNVEGWTISSSSCNFGACPSSWTYGCWINEWKNEKTRNSDT